MHITSLPSKTINTMRIPSPRRSIKKVLTDSLRGGLRGSSASFSVDFGTKGEETTTLSTASADERFKVRFDILATQYHEAKHPLDEDDNQWYTADDAVAFRKECGKLARILKAAERTSADTKSWSRTMLTAYQGFCEAETASEIMQVFETQKAVPMEAALGLETWIIRPIHFDRMERRQRLLSQIKALQLRAFSSDRSNKICKVSRALSRPSRLYAHHSALLLTESLQETKSN